MGHVFGGVRTDPLQHVDEVVVGIDALKSARAQEALDDAELVGAQLRPAEEPIFSTQRNGANLSFDGVRVYGHIGI